MLTGNTHVTLLVPDGESLSSTRSFGIDPSRTLIWTALPHDSADGIHEQMRLAQILLRDLASGTGSLSAGFIDYLSAPRCDPILKLYAAMVVYNCLEREVSPAPETHYPGGEANDSLSGFRKSWLGFSDEMLEGATRGGMPPDLTVGLWQAERLNSRLRPKKKVAAYIQMPTMLECAWRWAIARTTKDRLALQGFASIRAAARTAGGTTPWLCWQASAAKAINQTSKVPTGQKLDELIHKVAGKTREIRLRNESVGRNFTLPGFVPAEAAIAALRAEAIIEDQDRSREAFVSPAASLAMALALPEAALGARLQRTLELLDEAIADMLPQASPEAANARRDVPGWIARIRHKDDPNKERFGGRSKASGFELVARFKLTESSNFAWIFLEIDGPIADGETAIFYLHDSFRPARREAEFKNGRAKLKVASWGGFTVGAWVPRLQTMLELDLAQVKDAPRIIKDR